MGISKAADYAMLTVAYLATVSRESNGLRSKAHLSHQLKLPKEFLSQILQKLTRSGILTSERGVKGGYFLSKYPDEITFKDVIEAVDGKKTLVECLSEDFENCGRLDMCGSLILKMQEVQKKVDEALNSMHFGEVVVSQLYGSVTITSTSNR
mgnify:FL=1